MSLIGSLDDYLIEHICRVLSIPELLTFMQTCRKFSQIGQVILNQRHQNLILQPPTEIRVNDGTQMWKDDDYLIERIYQRLNMKDTCSLTQTCRKVSQIGQVILNQRHQNLILQPPTETLIDGTQIWKDEKHEIHRGYDLPAVILSDGSKEWYLHGSHHRNHDRPAIIYADGTKQWYQHNRTHRDQGLPAVIHADGKCEWWVYGQKVDQPSQ